MAEKPTTIKGAIMALNPKVSLAFFLVVVAAAMVFTWIIRPPKTGADGIDAGTVALIASFVTMFIKMAADAIGYQYNSSSGSDKKDDTQAAVAGKLAEKVSTPNPPIPPSIVVAWWSALSAEEQAALQASAATDPNVQAFIDAAKIGRATPEQLAYLVSKIPPLLTQERVDTIKVI